MPESMLVLLLLTHTFAIVFCIPCFPLPCQIHSSVSVSVCVFVCAAGFCSGEPDLFGSPVEPCWWWRHRLPHAARQPQNKKVSFSTAFMVGLVAARGKDRWTSYLLWVIFNPSFQNCLQNLWRQRPQSKFKSLVSHKATASFCRHYTRSNAD